MNCALTELPNTVWIFAGSVVASLIVLFSGWLQQKISRASTVSGYRQKWIQDIRDSFSEYLLELETIADAAVSNNVSDISYGAKSTIAAETRALRSKLNYFRLYTNPNESNHSKFLTQARNLENYVINTVRQDFKINEYEVRKAVLVGKFQDIIKEEWDRVKLGEIRWRLRRAWRRITDRCS